MTHVSAPDGLEDALALAPGMHCCSEALLHLGTLIGADQPRSCLECTQPLLCLRHLRRTKPGSTWGNGTVEIRGAAWPICIAVRAAARRGALPRSNGDV